MKVKQYKYRINGNLYNVTVNSIDEETNIASIEVNGTPYKVELERPAKQKAPIRPISNSVAAPKAPVSRPAPTSNKSAVKSPLPGVIVDVKVKEGDSIKKGDIVIILEAMKMENSIYADKDGKASAIKVNKGDSVLEGADLIVIE